MRILILFILHLSFFVCTKTSQAQEKINGPLIEKYGATFLIENPEFSTDISGNFQVVFDISKTAEDKSQVNPYINTVARFLNMHIQAGVPRENLNPVLVIHDTAAADLLQNEYYREKYGVDNPNLELLEIYDSLDIPVILCGQTALSRGVTADKRWKPTKLALSAMTALIQYQNNDYKSIAF